MTEERRAVPRKRVLKGGRIVINDGFSTFQCTVRNLTDIGARLKIASVIGIPDSFQLMMDDGRKFDATIVWKTEGEVGVKFG